MATAPERSKPLHNFSLPCLKWGTQRHLRCIKIPSNSNIETLPPDRRSRPSSQIRSGGTELINIRSSKSPIAATSKLKSIVNEDRDNGIEAVREKLMLDLRVAVNKMEVSIIEGVVVAEEDDAAAAARPWNLRTRRAACKAPALPCEEKWNRNLSPTREERKEKVKFSVSLLKEEVEDDFAAMIGKRPPRRPKKRAKIVQRQLDSIFPGLWLTEITPEIYEVPDNQESEKG